MSTTDQFSALKERHHATWAAGDYGQVARRVQSVADACVERAGVEAGQDVLDVATGTGNAAVVAAGRGARVVGLDLTPELFDEARERARALGVEVEWIAGDAEALPFEDASFDRVLSTFGVQFAPRHEITARELARVCRPDGLIVLCNWASDGKIGELFKLMGRYLPKPPEGVNPPPLWGDEAHVRGLFEPLGVELSFERGTAEWSFESPAAFIDFFEAHYGPTIKAKEALEPKGEWAALREEWEALAARFFDAERGLLLPDYWVITGRRAG